MENSLSPALLYTSHNLRMVLRSSSSYTLNNLWHTQRALIPSDFDNPVSSLLQSLIASTAEQVSNRSP
ncbi:hypothetical protein KCU83_g414, partial [Aureobasidium melanogenum]